MPENPIAAAAERLFTRAENFAKGVVFDCHHCGQCVLTPTKYICPMSCPRQLRNGPCGGSINEHCEVFPERKCVWVRIHHRQDKDGRSLPALLRSPDPKLFFTSSWLNYVTGKDKVARTPIEYLDLGHDRKAMPLQTESPLEAKLKSGRFIFTTEVRSPRTGNRAFVEKRAAVLKDHFDAANATAFLNGHPSMPSSTTSAILVEAGLDPICQNVCRDYTKTAFISDLLINKMNGVHNVLCLTGDYYQGAPVPKQVFDMDSALMLYEARFLREKGSIHFSGDEVKEPPKPFLGAAINPYTTPANVPVRRVKQKCAAGADFIQTQVLLDLKVFREFMHMFCEEGLNKELFLLAGLPVIISEKALAMMPEVPGLIVPETVKQRFSGNPDIVKEGIQFARELIQEVRGIQGVDGVHLMLFGLDHTVLPQVVEGLREG
ncbi:MAG TPA: methylenetetrahydrofolate reductase C-terminal domain-containing protein [Candidatus Hydrogenedentes bacterium]|nr:methylenetetrahydrofolate reductase C-terminal domain-containing protein [Candidatus Hydrogenedentota bacterium]HPG67874.1 methylenetetrahydrofolate reductase C-terminal domain-containing protein [Candidatus Hydrogenedentota bacterium]